MAKKKQEECPPPGAPAWMVTYGDMMTLLLTFFVLILSFSSIEKIKFKAAISSVQEGLGIWPESAGIMPQIVLYDNVERAEETEEVIDEIAEMMRQNEIAEDVEVYNTPEGIRLVISDPLLFRSGSAELSGSFQQLLGGIAETIRDKRFSDIRVEGHTDNVPIQTSQYPSNWELSTARALSVVKYFAFEQGFEPAQLSAVGYGEYRPRAGNETAEGRGKNRRVEIYLLHEKSAF